MTIPHKRIYDFSIDLYVEVRVMPSIKCKDIGMTCGFEIKDDSWEELMQLLALHAEKTHNLKTIPPELMQKIQKAIKK